MKKYFFPKTIGIAVLSMITLVSISIFEVAIYAYLVDPGHEEIYYQQHAKVSAPWISIVFGFPLFFLVVRLLRKKLGSKLKAFVILYPLCYQVIDVLIVAASGGVDWASFVWLMLLAFTAKVAGTMLAYYRYAKLN